MKTAIQKLIAGALMLLCIGAHAGTQIVGYVTITNTPAGLSSNIVINIGSADTRYWTNSVLAAPTTSIQTTNSTAASATNLVAHLTAYPVYSAGAGTPQLLATLNSTNTSVVNLYAPDNTNITVTFGGNWARVVYVTNTFSEGVPILNRTNSMASVARTNAENAIVNLLAVNRATNAVPLNAAFLRNYVDTNTAQTMASKTLIGSVLSGGRFTTLTNLTGTNVALTNVTLRLVTASGATITEGNYTGVIGSLTNGSIFSNFLVYSRLFNPVTTNLINYGSAIRSDGPGVNSLQVGSNAVASGSLSLAIGNDSVATNTRSVAIGNSAVATNVNATAIGYSTSARSDYATAVGTSATASGSGAVAFGYGATSTGQSSVSVGDVDTLAAGYGDIAIGLGAEASGGKSIAIGSTAYVPYSNSVAIGYSAAATTTNQIRLGTASETLSVPGIITAPTATNATLRGTNVINGRVDLVARSNSGMANGYNSATVLGTNVLIRLSGHSAAVTNAGFAAGVDGTFHVVQVDNPGLSYTLLHDSGLDTAANRIYTGTGALVNSTNNPVLMQVIYDANVSRWRILSFR